MIHRFLLFALLFILTVAAKNDRPAYLIYNEKGKEVKYSDMLEMAAKADIVLFGELHANPICHWLELELAKDLYELKGKNLVLGMEMFERDNQLLIEEYMKGMIRKKDFEAEAKLWKNYKTDYAPIVDFAREKGIKFVATNVPRRYAAIVNQNGFEGLDSLNALERGLMAPLPIRYDPELKSYKDIASASSGMPAHASPNLAKAQALKDATMAHFILKNGSEGQTFLHFHGTYHSEIREGIAWYIDQAMRRIQTPLKVLTIASVEQDTLSGLKDENRGKADFIICIPSSMTSSD